MFTTAFEECIEGKGQKSEGRSNAVLQRTQALTIAWLHFVLHVHFFGLIIIKAYFIDIKENKTHASISSCNFYMRRNVHVFLFCMRFSLNSSRQILENINKLASWVSFAPNTVTLFFKLTMWPLRDLRKGTMSMGQGEIYCFQTHRKANSLDLQKFDLLMKLIAHNATIIMIYVWIIVANLL